MSTMKKTTVKLVEPKVDTDKVKRVYRAAQDTIRRLDEIGKQKRAYRDVFMPEAIHLRSRLQDYCERLMLYGPLEYGRKAEELLWRKVYYDVIQLMKHNRKQMKLSNSLESAFRTHLAAAMGYYHHLLVRLQSEFHLSLNGIIDFFHVPEPRSHQRLHQIRKTEPDMRVQEWATRACHRCLVYLGDLSRYQQEYDGMTSRVISQRYYHEALLLSPQIGMPHNQLGTLAGTRYYSLDAAYHYFRCLLCVESFDGAQGNLTRLLEKNRKRYQELSVKSPRDLPPTQQRAKDIKRFLVQFLNLLDVLLTAAPSIEAKTLQDYCQTTLQQFNLCMLYLPPHVTAPTQSHDCQDERLLQYLEDDIVFKVIVICMMTVYQLQTTGNKRVTAAIAFSLALFSHVLNHVVMRLQATLCELENPSRLGQTDSPDIEEMEGTEETEEEKREEGTEKKEEMNGEEGNKELGRDRHPQKTHRVRRRRRCVSDSLSESAGSGLSSDESDLSEGERALLGGSIMPSVCTMDSDDDVVNFANQSDSESDSDDNLMVSQELWSGFSVQAFSNQMDAIEELSGHETVGSPSSHSLDSGSQSPMLTLGSRSGDTSTTVTQSNGELPDAGDYLKEFPLDWLSDSSNLFHHGLPFASSGAGDQHLDAIMQGQREVRVPPGFEQSEESLHVQEITEKITHFVIETDTDTSSFPTDTETSTVTESEVDTEVDTDHESVTDNEEVEHRRQERLVRVITNEGLLASIKVYCDWMRCNTSIIATCAKSSQSLWSRLSVLLNFLPLEGDLATPELCGRSLLEMVSASTTGDWTQTQPLSEDIHLNKFPPLVDTHSSLVFDVHSRLDLADTQEAVLRVCCLRNFGHYMAGVDGINLTFDNDKGMFYGPLPPQSEQDDKCTQQQMADAEARRNQLMRDMAQLRLQTEVSQLEGSVLAADHPSLPPYLVPDACVLCDSLSLLKQLAASARFIIIIPLVVIDQLDILKKDSVGAREAIRWLEADFRKGNWYVRAQKNHEKTAALPLKNLKKKDRDAWRFLQIVDCCKYLAQQSGDCEPRGLACILSPYKVISADISIRVKQAISNAQQDGIAVQTALEFHTKWKDMWKTSRG